MSLCFKERVYDSVCYGLLKLKYFWGLFTPDLNQYSNQTEKIRII